jgi:hypothetical protein
MPSKRKGRHEPPQPRPPDADHHALGQGSDHGAPDRAHISTSLVERQNLTMRMSIRRFTRLTNAFSKKVENHRAAVALHFAHYNFVRMHRTIECSPAMAAGVSKHLWSLEEMVERVTA